MINKNRFYFFPLIIFFLGIGCDIAYDAESRVLFSSKIVDSNNNPIENIEVKAIARGDFNNQEIIGIGTSDNNGFFKVIFPPPKNEDVVIDLLINENSLNENVFLPYRVENLNKNDFVNFGYTPQVCYLLKPDEVINFRVTFIRQNFNIATTLVEVTINGIASPINRTVIKDENDIVIKTIYDFIVKKEQQINLVYKLKTNQNLAPFNFSYSITNQNFETNITY